MLKDYATRVRAAYEMLRQTLWLLNETHRGLQVAVTQADAQLRFATIPPLAFACRVQSYSEEHHGGFSRL